MITVGWPNVRQVVWSKWRTRWFLLTVRFQSQQRNRWLECSWARRTYQSDQEGGCRKQGNDVVDEIRQVTFRAALGFVAVQAQKWRCIGGG